MKQASAIANPNIALIKYWGNRHDELRLPANGSISFSLAGLRTVTHVRFEPDLPSDQLTINQRLATDRELARVSAHLELIRQMASIDVHADIDSENNFPSGAGIASSASAFAALTLAATSAVGLDLSPQQLSSLARRGSGSAARSIHPGFVEWYAGDDDQGSYAESIAPPDHWPLIDLIAIVNQGHKEIGSTQGHQLAPTSPMQPGRVKDAPRRLEICRRAILEKDFAELAEIVEQDSNLMHAVMMTSTPQLFYWEPASIELMRLVHQWREEGLSVCYTLDAGPNVHCITIVEDADEVEKRLGILDPVQQVIRCLPGSGARLVEKPAS
jgi:diphosphomevalonate decarboxylase